MYRVGLGQDSHRFSDDPDRKLVLAGVEIAGARGLDGNSDADVILHALCRALEQAIGEDEFSRYADEMSGRGINDSREYVRVAISRVTQAGYRVNNVGLTIEGQTPKFDPIRAQMKASVAAKREIPIGAIGLNGTTGADMTTYGKGEGVQAFAIVCLVKRA